MVILAWSLQREKKVLLRKENPVGPGTEVSPTASKRQHAGGGEVMELTQDATVVTAHTDAISEFHRMTQNYALFTPNTADTVPNFGIHSQPFLKLYLNYLICQGSWARTSY